MRGQGFSPAMLSVPRPMWYYRRISLCFYHRARNALKYSLAVAYALWAISGFGALGLHRFYLGKSGSGFVWLFTGGLAGIGGIYDLFTMPRQVRESNLRHDAEAALALGTAAMNDRYGQAAGLSYRRAESPEKTILRVARQNGGLVTPGEVRHRKRYFGRRGSQGTGQARQERHGGNPRSFLWRHRLLFRRIRRRQIGFRHSLEF